MPRSLNAFIFILFSAFSIMAEAQTPPAKGPDGIAPTKCFEFEQQDVFCRDTSDAQLNQQIKELTEQIITYKSAVINPETPSVTAEQQALLQEQVIVINNKLANIGYDTETTIFQKDISQEMLSPNDFAILISTILMDPKNLDFYKNIFDKDENGNPIPKDFYAGLEENASKPSLLTLPEILTEYARKEENMSCDARFQNYQCKQNFHCAPYNEETDNYGAACSIDSQCQSNRCQFGFCAEATACLGCYAENEELPEGKSCCEGFEKQESTDPDDPSIKNNICVKKVALPEDGMNGVSFSVDNNCSPRVANTFRDLFMNNERINISFEYIFNAIKNDDRFKLLGKVKPNAVTLKNKRVNAQSTFNTAVNSIFTQFQQSLRAEDQSQQQNTDAATLQYLMLFKQEQRAFQQYEQSIKAMYDSSIAGITEIKNKIQKYNYSKRKFRNKCGKYIFRNNKKCFYEKFEIRGQGQAILSNIESYLSELEQQGSGDEARFTPKAVSKLPTQCSMDPGYPASWDGKAGFPNRKKYGGGFLSGKSKYKRMISDLSALKSMIKKDFTGYAKQSITSSPTINNTGDLEVPDEFLFFGTNQEDEINYMVEIILKSVLSYGANRNCRNLAPGKVEYLTAVLNTINENITYLSKSITNRTEVLSCIDRRISDIQNNAPGANEGGDGGDGTDSICIGGDCGIVTEPVCINENCEQDLGPLVIGPEPPANNLPPITTPPLGTPTSGGVSTIGPISTTTTGTTGGGSSSGGFGKSGAGQGAFGTGKVAGTGNSKVNLNNAGEGISTPGEKLGGKNASASSINGNGKNNSNPNALALNQAALNNSNNQANAKTSTLGSPLSGSRSTGGRLYSSIPGVNQNSRYPSSKGGNYFGNNFDQYDSPIDPARAAKNGVYDPNSEAAKNLLKESRSNKYNAGREDSIFQIVTKRYVRSAYPTLLIKRVPAGN